MPRSHLLLSFNGRRISRSTSANRAKASQTSLRLTFFAVLAFVSTLSIGCGTTKFSDTSRTATEQLLISSAMEDLVDEYDYTRLSGLKVFVKSANTTTDGDYLKSLVRQQLAANGAFVKDAEDAADYIVEIAPGTVGTNRYDLMYGIPETTVPAIGTLTTATSIPEFALIKRTDQKAQVKLVMWAYNKTTGSIIWQSGIDTKSARIRDRWIFGAGPFTTATFDKKGGVRLGADDALPTPTFGERVVGEDAAALTSDAVYQELDEKAIERLQKIREEGLAKAVEETAEEKLDVEENGEEKEEPDKGDKTKEASDAAKVAKAPEPEVKEPVKVASVPPQPDPNRELDLGYDSKINLGAVYVPPSAPQRR